MPLARVMSGAAYRSRTDAIQAAFWEILNRHRAIIDAADDLAAITLSVKLQNTQDPVRAVTYEDQRIMGRRLTHRFDST